MLVLSDFPEQGLVEAFQVKRSEDFRVPHLLSQIKRGAAVFAGITLLALEYPLLGEVLLILMIPYLHSKALPFLGKHSLFKINFILIMSDNALGFTLDILEYDWLILGTGFEE